MATTSLLALLPGGKAIGFPRTLLENCLASAPSALVSPRSVSVAVRTPSAVLHRSTATRVYLGLHGKRQSSRSHECPKEAASRKALWGLGLAEPL